MKIKLKKIFKIIILLLLFILVAFGIYALYMILSYSRLPDNLDLEVKGKVNEKTIELGHQYSILSYNIGFGAYESDYGFFMDGGTQSRAWSKERLVKNMQSIGDFVSSQDADFVLLQEVDVDGTRSYHYNEYDYLSSRMQEYENVFAQNFDSSYIIFPIYQPHGSNKGGLVTYSSINISKATRFSLPIEEDLMKFFDLDRCYMVMRIPTNDGKELVLINLHLSAYSSDGSISDEQLKLIINYMDEEYKKGNYVIAGGDLNKDLTGQSANYDKTFTWALPIDPKMYEGTSIRQITPTDPTNSVFSCRNADGPYNPDQFVFTPDGFLVSENVDVISSEVINLSFKNSDHNPISMVFCLSY